MRRFTLFICCIFAQVLTACGFQTKAEFFLLDSQLNKIQLIAHSGKAAQGIVDLVKPRSYVYTAEEVIPIPDDYSLEINYSINYADKENDLSSWKFIVKINDGVSWEIPTVYSFLGIDGLQAKNKYSIPVNASTINNIIFSTKRINNDTHKSIIKINGISLAKRKYGFEKLNDTIFTTPFVYVNSEKNIDTISIAEQNQYKIKNGYDLYLAGYNKNTSIRTGGIKYQFYTQDNINNAITLPKVFIADSIYPIDLSGTADAFLLCSAPDLADEEPIAADPRLILEYPLKNWRQIDYECFRWDIFPSIIIFDTKNYNVQDRFFKRLAFFSEKKGFRGRLAGDDEIASLHGWNAHDYNAKSLAVFFDSVKKSNFPITNEEKKLLALLLDEKIIKDNKDGSGYIEGEGVVLSISRESPDYLRRMFMVHEGFHGIYFIDEEFRNFCKERWAKFDGTAKRFINSYFDYQQYDIKDNYLVVNEFMAHCLQQPVPSAAKYFGETIASRIDASSWRRSVLPPKNEENGNWPQLAAAFTGEAAEFSVYVNKRWGLSAGRVWRIRATQADQD